MMPALQAGRRGSIPLSSTKRLCFFFDLGGFSQNAEKKVKALRTKDKAHFLRRSSIG
jgi:hypothetical protein